MPESKPTTPPTAPKKRLTLAEVRAEFAQHLEATELERDRLAEALSSALGMLRQEDVGWAAPGEGTSYRGLTLPDIKRWSDQIRAILTGTEKNAPNPHMRNGLMLRHSFIWDGGMQYQDVPGQPSGPANPRGKKNVWDLITKTNWRRVFSPDGRRVREAALFADGLYVLMGENGTKKLTPVPLHEITDTLRDELNEDEIVAYRWTRNEAVRDGRGVPTGQRERRSVWVYVDWYEGRKYEAIEYAESGAMAKPEPVLKGWTAFDMHANRTLGQAYGSPDAIAALVWSRIIRDLIMNGVKMQDALAMFAFKATSKSKKAQNNVGMEVIKGGDAGSVANMGDDIDLAPLNTAGKGYDFSTIGFVVATMAASLHVSGIALSANTALAGSSYGAAKTLDLPGRMAMTVRRQEHIEFDLRLLRWFGAPEEATPYFKSFEDATDEYRAVQAAMLAWSTGTLTPEAFREELENIYGHKFIGEIPNGVMLPNNKASLPRRDIDTDSAEGGDGAPKQAAAPDQGRNSAAGKADHASDLPSGDA